MAKKKKKAAQQVFLSPEKYIRQKARSLKIKACYERADWDFGNGAIFVVREHDGGRLTVGAYFIDSFCCGVKDTYFLFRANQDELDEILEENDHIVPCNEISYEEAHNRIYGAMAFAEEAGISPHKGFAITRYILEEDDDNIPLIEYEYGHNGQHFLVASNGREADKYLPLLEKNLGDNFKWCYADEFGDDDDEYDEYDDDEYDDDFDDYEEYDDNEEEISSSQMFSKIKDSIQNACDMIKDSHGSMTEKEQEALLEKLVANIEQRFRPYAEDLEYSYTHPEYPLSLTIENPIVEEILCAKKNNLYLTKKQIDSLLALPHDSLRRDLEQLILYRIGQTCDKANYEFKDSDNEFMGTIANAIVLLAEVGNDTSSLDVVLEVMRQSLDFSNYHIYEAGPNLFCPAIYKLGHNHLDKLKDFMLEKGLCGIYKSYMAQAITFFTENEPERRDEAIEWLRQLIVFATNQQKDDKLITSIVAEHLVASAVELRAQELLPELKALFDTGQISGLFCGNFKNVSKELKTEKAVDKEIYPIDIYERVKTLADKFKNKSLKNANEF